MADDIQFDLSTGDFDRAAARLFAYSKRDGETFTREQVRGFLRLVIDMTPPSRGSTRGVKAKKSGEQAVQRDVRNVFVPTQRESLVEMRTLSDMRTAMGAKKRKRGGRIIYQAQPKIRVRRQLLKQFIKQRQTAVGFLASGWHGAAKALGSVRVPAWISRHHGPGNTRITSTRGAINAEITNQVTYASDVYNIERRVNAALQVQARRMNRRLAYYMANAAKKAGFR